MDSSKAKALFPNISMLIKRGFERSIVSNGHATKFAMAPIFSQTYPLDYDGYNYVMQNRPRSFVEEILAHNHTTHMFQADDNDGPVSCCERGFNTVEAIYDGRILLQNYIAEVLSEECRAWQAGKYSNEEISKILQESFGAVLKHLHSGKFRVVRRGLPSWIAYPNKRLKAAFKCELILLNDNPIAVANKILTLEPHFYHLGFGQVDPKSFYLSALRFIYWIGGVLRSRLISNNIFPFRLLKGNTSVPVKELLKGAYSVMKNNTHPWFIFAHIMDIHDRRQMDGLKGLFTRIVWYRNWSKYQRVGQSINQLLYDYSLAKIDAEVGKMMKYLRDTNQEEDTTFVISADHGCEMYDGSLRGHQEDFGWRTHGEHIVVPLICAPTDQKPSDLGLFDSMTFSATVLDLLNITPHTSFKGQSIFSFGRDAVITENAGRGNANIKLNDLYFTITTEFYKAMAVLVHNKLQFCRLYNLKEDPQELQNIIDKPNCESVIAQLVNYMFRERGDLLKNRGVERDSVVISKDKNHASE